MALSLEVVMPTPAEDIAPAGYVTPAVAADVEMAIDAEEVEMAVQPAPEEIVGGHAILL